MAERRGSEIERVIVTGASRGIGRGIATVLARAGFAVGVLARSRDPLETLVEAIGATGGRAHAATADVRDPEDLRRAIGSLVETLGGVDALVNNAGVVLRKGVEEITDEEWDTVMRTNVDGVFHATRAVLPHLIAQGHGRIVNVSSISGRVPLPGGSAYAASKYAVTGFSESLFHELRDHGIQVSVVFPGSVAPDDDAERDDEPGEDGGDHRLRPQEVGETILHLLTTAPGNCLHQVEIRPLQRPS